MNTYNLQRFLDAQNQAYLRALSEIQAGQKKSHWMWYIFPQMKDLGRSETAIFYGIENLQEAREYLAHPVLGKHLIEITQEVLNINDKSANEIFGNPDDLKLRSSMTLFAHVEGSDPVFQQILDKFYDGIADEVTLNLLKT